MRFHLFFVILAMVLLACKNETSKPHIKDKTPSNKVGLPIIQDCGYEVSDTSSTDWQLIFEDQFDDNYQENWTAWNSGAYNEELQYYQEENVFTEHGFLYLYGKRESAKGQSKPKEKKLKQFDFTSGRIESKQLFGPKDVEGKKHMKFSARIRLVEGEGLWPAWWSYGHPWPTEGEIDILEARGNRPYEFSSCLHYGEKEGVTDTKIEDYVFEYKHADKLTDCFHVYDMEWSEDSIKILFDEKLVKEYDVENHPFVKDFWLKENMLCLNLAIGGIFFKSVDVAKIPTESFYVVDWVRVFEK